MTDARLDTLVIVTICTVDAHEPLAAAGICTHVVSTAKRFAWHCSSFRQLIL